MDGIFNATVITIIGGIGLLMTFEKFNEPGGRAYVRDAFRKNMILRIVSAVVLVGGLLRFVENIMSWARFV